MPKWKHLENILRIVICMPLGNKLKSDLQSNCEILLRQERVFCLSFFVVLMQKRNRKTA